MDASLTLLFICDRPHTYETFISEFRSADFRVLIARNLTQAKATLLSGSVHAVVIRHDDGHDDRPLAAKLKRIAARLPVFLITNQAQLPQPNIDSVWRGDFGDEVVTRGMATFFRHLLKPSGLTRGVEPARSEFQLFLAGLVPQSVG